MQELLTYLLKSLTDHPDEVNVDVNEDDINITATLSVHGDDMGKVIGKEGKTINAIRTLAKVLAIRQKKKLTINLGS